MIMRKIANMIILNQQTNLKNGLLGRCNFFYSSRDLQEKDQPSQIDVNVPSIMQEAKDLHTNALKINQSIQFQELNSQLISHDYTNSKTKIRFNASEQDDQIQNLQGFQNSGNGLQMNSKSELSLKDNPLALKILTENKIDIHDQRIQINSLNMSDSKLFGSQINDIHSISLGSINVLPQNSILLEDIDVNNIPEDKTIIIDNKKKTLYAIGRKVLKKTEPLELIENSKLSSSHSNYLTVNKSIFEETSLNEYKDKYLWTFEKDFVMFDFTMLFRALISIVPLLVFSGFFIESCMELYKCKRDLSLMEDQHLIPFQNLKLTLQSDILLNDVRFNRKQLFPPFIHNKQIHIQNK